MPSVGKITINLSAGTAEFIADLDKANAKLRDFGSSGGRTKNSLREIGDAGQYSVTGVQAASGALRVLEGNLNNNIRAGERFLVNFLGLGPALQKVFPIAGGLALIGIFEHLGQEVFNLYEAFKNFQEAPQRIAQGFNSLSQSAHATNDELDVTNARLANEIAKLEGKPQNALAESLAEAKKNADDLADSLQKDIERVVELLNKEKIGALKGLFTDTAPTADILDRAKALQNQLVQIDLETRRKLRETTDPTAQQTLLADAQKRRRDAIEHEIKGVSGELDTAKAKETARNNPNPGQVVGVIQGVPIYSNGGPAPQEQDRRINSLAGYLDNLLEESDRFPKEDLKSKLTGQLKSAQAQNDAAALTRPYLDKIHELDAQIAGLNTQLASIGKSSTAEVLAKSWTKAQEAITKLNDELAKHHQQLTLAQQVELVTRFDQEALTQAEVEWKTKLEQTTTTIQDRITSLKSLTGAIGQGYEAQKQANVETQLAKELGQKANDPEWVRTHASDVAGLRSRIGSEYDAQQSNKTATTLDQLSTQIELEKSLATAEARGAEAVRQATLDHQLSEIAKNNSAEAAKKLIAAETELSDAQQKARAASTLAQLQQEIDATNRLTAAQLGGAEAVRKAQLQNRIAEIRRSVPAPYQDAEIQKTTQISEAQHRQQVLTDALKTGQAYQNHLDSIDEQIAALQQVKATQGDTLAVEISLRDLEKERAKVWADQVQVLGTARDGLKAYFGEMATDGVSAAQEVHDALKTAFDSLNDTLAKLVAGQKVNWASFFESISNDLAKMALHNLEAQIAGKIFRPQQQQGHPQQSPTWRQIHPGNRKAQAPPVGGLNLPGSNPGANRVNTRDGQTVGTALFVATVSDTASENPAPSASALPASPNDAAEGNKLAGILGLFAKFGGLFGGFRALGGDVSDDAGYVVGENGPEFFVPDSDGTIVPHHKLKNALAFLKPRRASGPDANQLAEANALDNQIAADRDEHPEAFNNIQSHSKVTHLSLPTKPAGNQWLQVVQFAQIALRSLGGSGGSGGDASGGDAAASGGASAADTQSDPNAGYTLTRLPSGLILRQSADQANPPAELTSEDQANLEGMAGDLSQLDNSGGYPDLGADSLNAAYPDNSSSGSGNSNGASGGGIVGQLAMFGASLGLGVLAKILSRPPNHHFKPGSPYYIPSWGGYRAAGGAVDPGHAYMVGEEGPELWTPPASGGQIVPNHLLNQNASGGDTYIDARGTDPAAVERRVRQGMQAAHNSAVRSSFKTYTEYQQRTPQN